MFNFIKKTSSSGLATGVDREEKERRKKEKKERKEREKKERGGGHGSEDILRIDDVRRSLKLRSRRKDKEKLPSGITADYSAQFLSEYDREQGHSVQIGREGGGGGAASDSSENSLSSMSTSHMSHASSTTHSMVTVDGKVLPPLPPRPPKRGILKGPKINVVDEDLTDDNGVLLHNTRQNELITYSNLPNIKHTSRVFIGNETARLEAQRNGGMDNHHHQVASSVESLTTEDSSSFLTPPFSTSPVGEGQGFHSRFLSTQGLGFGSSTEDLTPDLPLPSVPPPPLPAPRQLTIHRQAGRTDFGFSLRRAMIVERSGSSGSYLLKPVIFAEPGDTNNNSNSGCDSSTVAGLLPGDRLLEVNGEDVHGKTREEIIDLIRASESAVTLRVQPVAELCELSRRSGADGLPVQLDDNYIRSGTLRRSASLRFKSSRAKSEEQLASEKSWLDTERVWLVHRAGFTLARPMDPTNQLRDGKLKVKVEGTGVELTVDEDDVEKCNPSQYDTAEDVCTLRHLNESSMLHTLRCRYASNLIHTYAGPTTLIVNPVAPLAIYSDKVAQMFKGCSSEDMPSHIYSTAQCVYRSLLSTRRDHSLLFLGRSGSGKTVNYNHALRYLVLTAGSVNKILTLDKLNAIQIVLDAFGHARTCLNLNATRMTHLLSLDFDQTGLIASASIQLLLLDKTRVVRRAEGESNYHVFYRLLAGADGTTRKELMLDTISSGAEPNSFIVPYSKHEDTQRGLMDFVRLVGALATLSVSESEIKTIMSMLAAVLHLGAAGAVKGSNLSPSGGSKYQFQSPGAAARAAKCLGVAPDSLARVIFSPPTSTGVGRRGDIEGVGGVEALESFAANLYAEILNSVGSLINRSLSSAVHTVCSLLLVDSPGVQNPGSTGLNQSGAGFNDLVFNYVQERLGLLFHHSSLVQPKDLYSQEHIDIPGLDPADDDCPSPQSLVSLLDHTPTPGSGKPPGLLWLLDEVGTGAGATSFPEMVFGRYAEREYHGLVRKAPGQHFFIVQHNMGTNPVLYNTESWSRLSIEPTTSRSIVSLLTESCNKDLVQLVTQQRSAGLGSTGFDMTGAGGAGGTGTRGVTASIRRSTQGIKRKSVPLQAKFTVDSLIETVRRSQLRFVHCLLPHHTAGLLPLDTRQTGHGFDTLINIPLLRSQLRGAQLLAAARLHKQGYPRCMPLAEFRRRFQLLSLVTSDSSTQPTSSSGGDDKAAVEDILLSLDLDHSSYRVGLSQIFFRSGVLPQLEAERDQKLSSRVILFQARCRGFLSRKHLAKLKVQDVAVRCLQRNIRKFMDVRDWSWWRLYLKIHPLLNVHRADQELQAKTEELAALKSKLEKLEMERNILKQDNTRLESKLGEITEDYADEHSTATLVSERLSHETTERAKLERDLAEAQAVNKKLQESSDKLELEVQCLRSTSELISLEDGEDGSLAEGGSSESNDLYRKKWERAIRELEFTKHRLNQQHQDDLEQLVGLRKQLEKKLSDAFEQIEEQRHVASEWKRKVTKVNSEMSDLRLLLEEQSSRNNLLEKKQRKFDAEYQMLQDELRQERNHKEKALRDKELALGDKYTMEQNLSSLKLELELKEQKVSHLQQELEELTFSGNTEEEVANLKKKKHSLEAKLSDQEEELDELAGQVQMLEQAKLKVEMNLEQVRKSHRKELASKDEELEALRCSTMKKVKALQCQLESEHESRTALLRERHELERRLNNLEDNDVASRTAEVETNMRLKRDLKRTKALLKDTQTMLSQSRQDNANKLMVRQLRNQLEDAEHSRSASIKAKQTLESDLADISVQLEETQRSKADLESRLSAVLRERGQLQSQLDENEEEMTEVLKKYQASVQQLSTEQTNLQEATTRISELETELSSYKDQLAELNSKLESIETHGDPSSTLALKRLQLKSKELESKLEFEHTTRSRLEVQINRLKETTDKLQSECNLLRGKDTSNANEVRKHQRVVRELKESIQAMESKQINESTKRKELEKELQSRESEVNTLKSELAVASQRIADLQHAIQGDLEDDSSDSENSDDNSTDHELDPSSDEDDGDLNHVDLLNYATTNGYKKTKEDKELQ